MRTLPGAPNSADYPNRVRNLSAKATSPRPRPLRKPWICCPVRSRASAHTASTMRIESSTFVLKPACSRITLTADELHYEMTALAGGKISIVLRREALGCGRARDWNAVVPRAFSPHEL